MKRASSKSRPKHLFVIILALVFMITALLAHIGISGVLHKLKPKISDYLSSAFGYRLTLENISFGIFKGLHVSGISIFYSRQDKSPDLFIKDAFLGISPFSALSGKIAVSNIKISEAVLLTKRKADGYNLQIIYSDICKKILEDKAMASGLSANKISIFVETAKLFYADNPSLEKNTLILLKKTHIEQKGDKFKLNAEVQFYYNLPEGIYISRFLKDHKENKIRQDMKLSIQGNVAGENLNMGLITLNLGKEQLLGMGVTRNFMTHNPDMDIMIIPSSLSLGNIDFVKSNFDSEGTIFISLKFNGPMDNLKTNVYALLENCSFTYNVASGELFNIQELRGELDYRNDRARLTNGHLKFNDIPLSVELQVNVLEGSDINFSAAVSKEFLSLKKLPLDKVGILFKGKMDKTLQGNLEISALYLRKGLSLDMRANFKDIDFDYYNLTEKHLNSEAVEFSENSTPGVHRLKFTDLKSKIYVNRNNIAIKDINFSGYSNNVSGEINIDTTDNPLLTLSLIGTDLDIKPLMHDLNLSDKLISGRMNAKILFNNSVEDFLEGRCYIKDGIADLDAFAQVIRLPHLNNVNFDIIHGYFSVSKNNIKVRGIKLYSPDIMLDAYWNADGKIDGEANLKAASKLLNQSASFKKLLRLTRTKAPYVDFKFILGGSPKATRFMWMKNEFKEKMQSSLPAWARRSIESSLNNAIDELSVK